MTTILSNIAAQAQERVAIAGRWFRPRCCAPARSMVCGPDFPFERRSRGGRSGFICECKKALPLPRVIAETYDPRNRPRLRRAARPYFGNGRSPAGFWVKTGISRRSQPRFRSLAAERFHG
jgi:hypothetical protein